MCGAAIAYTSWLTWGIPIEWPKNAIEVYDVIVFGFVGHKPLILHQFYIGNLIGVASDVLGSGNTR